MENNDLDFFYQSKEQAPEEASGECWKILIVDDEEEVHHITRLALENFNFRGKGVSFLSAFSGKEAREVLRENRDISVIFLDVVMETNEAGLEVVSFIRQELNDFLVRIILRTGQPGQAPEETIIREYDINDYKEKTELTVKKLFTSLYSSLRSYENMKTLEYYRERLEERVLDQAEVIRDNNKFFSHFFHSLTEGLFLIENGKIEDVNPAALVLYGYSAAGELKGKNFETLEVSPDTAPDYKGKAVRDILWHRKKEGSLFPVEVKKGIFSFEGRSLECLLIRDMSPYQENWARQADYLSKLDDLLASMKEEGLSSGKKEAASAAAESESIRVLGISRQEENVIYYILEGLSNREIGHKLFIHEYTVKKHVSAVFRKIGLNSRAKLISFINENNYKVTFFS